MNVYYYNNTTNIVAPLSGYTLATQITCVPPNDIVDFLHSSAVKWYFGDGESVIATAHEGLSATHSYKLPGTYQISAVAYTDTIDDRYPQTIVATASCKIINYIDNALKFINIPPPTLPGYYTQTPYKLLYTTTNTVSAPAIDLYSEFSRSYSPQDPQNKWSFVRPEWKFVDLAGNTIKQVIPDADFVTLSGTVVGLSGYAEFYFIDDIYSIDFFIKDAPTPIIWASLQTSAINYSTDSNIKNNSIYGYSTTEVRAYAPHISYWKLPDYLKITENGVFDFTNTKWSNASVPFFVSAQIDANNVGNITPYNPDITFAKFLPYSVSARDLTYVPCAEDVDVYVTVTNSVSASFDSPSNTINVGEYKFNQTDATGYTAPGFTRGIVTVHDEGVMQISAKAIIDFNKLHLPIDALIYSPYVWLPNPAAASLSMIYYTGAVNEAFSKALHNQFSTNKIKNIYIPTISTIPSNELGTSGVYAVATSPGYEPDFDYYAWVADADTDLIHKYDSSANLVTSISLKNILQTDKVTPAYISLDGNKNLWVTCYDTTSVLKFDLDGNFLLSINAAINLPQVSPNIPGMFAANTSNIFEDAQVIEPTGIDTDTQNNIWVSYSNPISSYLVKYNQNGVLLRSLHLPVSSTPQDLLVCNDDSIWVSHSHEVYGDSGVLAKYDTNGTLITSFSNIPNLGYLTYDVDQNPWFTYDYNKIGKIINNTFTAVATITSIDSDFNTCPLQKSGYKQIQALEGIACTHKNFVFVIHSIENKIYIYNAKNNSLLDTINIYPHLSTAVYNDINQDTQQSNKWNKSIQAIGDWTGIRWSQKYKTYKFNQKIITGVSKPLNFSALNKQEIRKHNHQFNMAEQLKQLAMPYVIQNNTFLFDTFLQAIYGNAANIDDIGTTFYEKIANFVANHKDIDTCEIDSLYNIAALTDVSLDDYRFSYPAKLKQLMNMLSVPHNRLWGSVCSCQDLFVGDDAYSSSYVCESCGRSQINNKGEQLDTQTLILNTNTPIVVYDREEDNFFLHYPASYNGANSYPVTNLEAAGFKTPIYVHYDFYKYVKSSMPTFINGVIDWDNPNTTLTPNISSYNDWIQTEGVIDTILNFYLYSGLNLI